MRINEAFLAGITRQYNVVGNFLRLQSADGLAAGSVSIEFWAGARKLIIDMSAADPGDRIRTFPETFDRIEITSTVNQMLALQILRGDAGSDRITGEVSVIDGGRARTVGSVAYMGAASSAALAANYSHVQLWNPSATKRCVIEQVMAGASLVGSVQLVFHNAALTTLVGAIRSKLSGGADGPFQLRSQQNAAQIGTAAPFLGWHAQPAATPVLYPMKEPIVLTVNQGLIVRNSAVNADVQGHFECYEETI